MLYHSLVTNHRREIPVRQHRPAKSRGVGAHASLGVDPPQAIESATKAGELGEISRLSKLSAAAILQGLLLLRLAAPQPRLGSLCDLR